MTFTLEPLGPDHDLKSFECGNGEMDRWLVEHARNATGQGTRTSVVTDAGPMLGVGLAVGDGRGRRSAGCPVGIVVGMRTVA